MKLSSRYIEALECYLAWSRATTPAKGTFQEDRAGVPDVTDEEDRPGMNGVSAAEWLYTYESTGKNLGMCSEPNLLSRYRRGKMMRDWWSKEVGWWDKNATYIPEEWLGMLGPLPFIELFGREPITRIVRHYHDNSYKDWEFLLDNWAQKKQDEWGMWYYERDDRDSSMRNIWRMVRNKWISPFIFRLKAKCHNWR